LAIITLRRKNSVKGEKAPIAMTAEAEIIAPDVSLVPRTLMEAGKHIGGDNSIDFTGTQDPPTEIIKKSD
jgi:hypothetical protein